MHQLEFHRQLLHLAYGFALIALHYYGWIDESMLLGAVIGGAGVSFMIKKQQLSPVAKILSYFEREHHMESFPGRGMIFFTLGTYLSFVFFEDSIAYASIAILSVGDAVSNFIGRKYGRTKTFLNSQKCIEGNVTGILASLPIAYLFFPNILAVFCASTVGMFLKIPCIRIYKFEVDDNMIIPMAAGFSLTLFS